MRFFRKPIALALCGLSLGTLTATYLQAIEHDGEGTIPITASTKKCKYDLVWDAEDITAWKALFGEHTPYLTVKCNKCPNEITWTGCEPEREFDFGGGAVPSGKAIIDCILCEDKYNQ